MGRYHHRMIGRTSLFGILTCLGVTVTGSATAAEPPPPPTAPAAPHAGYVLPQLELGFASPVGDAYSGLSSGPTVAGALRFGRVLKIGPTLRFTRLGWRTDIPTDEHLSMFEFGADVRVEPRLALPIVPYLGVGLGLSMNEVSAKSNSEEILPGGYLSLSLGADWKLDKFRLGLGLNYTKRRSGCSQSEADYVGGSPPNPGAPCGKNDTAGGYVSGAYEF